MDKLIYGKDDTARIIGMEVIDDQAEVFVQTDDGEVESFLTDNAYWIMTNYRQDRSVPLDGNLYYKYIRYYSKASEFFGAKKKLRNSGSDFLSIGDEKEALMVTSGMTYFKGLKQADVSVLSFDIESTSLEHNDKAKILIISNTFRKNGKVIRKMFCYDEYDDQGELIQAWVNWVNEVDPSIMIGHNIYSYDLPYIAFIASQYDVELTLGRNGAPLKFFNYESKKRIDGSREQPYHKVRCYGRELVDTMFLAINYDVATKKYESYGLKKIISQEKLEKEGRVFYDASQIRFKYKDPEEWSKIKAYCNDDSDDALALYDLMSPAFFYLTQAVPKSFQAIVETASGSQINAMMVRSYLQEGHSLPKQSMEEDFEGAISMGNPGIYRNAFKVDVASLYPSIMIHYKVYDKAKDPKGNMLTMVETFTAERLKNKKLAKDTGIKYYDDMQNAQKIVINSFYGFLGAGGLCFNSPKNAAFVTEKGREILRKAAIWACGHDFKKILSPKKKKDEEKYIWVTGDKVEEGVGYQIVNADTDSITFADGNPMSEDKRAELLNKLNSLFPDRIKFADDGYFPTVIVLKAKNYVLWDGKKMKIKGSALKDAKKEKALKEFLNKVVQSIIDDTNHYTDIYHSYVKEAANVTDIIRWSSKKTISGTVLKSERANETKIVDAIKGTEYVEGDKVWVYYRPDETLALAEKFDGVYDKDRLYEKIYKAACTFKTVLDPELFPNYSLKRNQLKLKEIVDG